METAKKHLSKGYDLLRKIMVCEDDVDRMALAKQELRAAYACLERAEKMKESGGDGVNG